MGTLVPICKQLAIGSVPHERNHALFCGVFSKLTWLRIMCGMLAVIGVILPEHGALILWLGVVIVYKELVPRCRKDAASVSS